MYTLTVHNAEDHPGRQFSDLINHLKYLYNLPSPKCYRETSRDILNNNLPNNLRFRYTIMGWILEVEETEDQVNNVEMEKVIFILIKLSQEEFKPNGKVLMIKVKKTGPKSLQQICLEVIR